jgi:hypothetical protein
MANILGKSKDNTASHSSEDICRGTRNIAGILMDKASNYMGMHSTKNIKDNSI